MQRTSITAMVLVGVAACAATGCVSVEAQRAPGPTGSPAGQPDKVVEPQIVQGPARDALEAALPKRTEAATSPPARLREKAAMPARPPQAPPPRPHSRAPQAPAVPRPKLPPLPEIPVDRGDVCDLGQNYGGWRADSPEARICRQAYGN
ncbi:hypothetical protein HW130_29740 [Streptomyces sp. PKU-EA00015]|uniref:hypothetical protein n=1 Tax=Streptomyces sp. PKU-EA00015 TaxID=2748326 RepID=UPI0015A132CD|nr:hypothetical protein [Streptomyces sp. PKU-EA00015]NWF30386.1 hypothetical protein [Streptomyces sp. PKU-EA00015]